ncbi:MAG: hypothetical protein KGJ02_08390 [Verrucomicrobiota bacterium]|nr:hypothetical protein [Verrucomicrobiota bacterium]
MNKFLFIFLFLFSLLKAESVSFEDYYSVKLESIRTIAHNYLDEAAEAGLSTPNLPFCPFGDWWVSYLVSEWGNYSDFQIGFNYLFGFSERSHASGLEACEEVICRLMKDLEDTTITPEYTQRDSKFGNLAKPAAKISIRPKAGARGAPYL